MFQVLDLTKKSFFPDTDVKMAAINYVCKNPSINLVIKSGSTSGKVPSIFYPSLFADYIEKTYYQGTLKKIEHSRSLVKAFIYFGNDHNPGKELH